LLLPYYCRRAARCTVVNYLEVSALIKAR